MCCPLPKSHMLNVLSWLISVQAWILVGAQERGCPRQKRPFETLLVVWWLTLRVPSAAGLGSIPDQGSRSHMLQLEPMQPNKIIFFKKVTELKAPQIPVIQKKKKKKI